MPPHLRILAAARAARKSSEEVNTDSGSFVDAASPPVMQISTPALVSNAVSCASHVDPAEPTPPEQPASVAAHESWDTGPDAEGTVLGHVYGHLSRNEVSEASLSAEHHRSLHNQDEDTNQRISFDALMSMGTDECSKMISAAVGQYRDESLAAMAATGEPPPPVTKLSERAMSIGYLKTFNTALNPQIAQCMMGAVDGTDVTNWFQCKLYCRDSIHWRAVAMCASS